MMSKLTRNSGRDNGKSETPADNGTADSTPKTPKHAKHVTDDAMDNDETGNDCPHGGSEEDREEEAMEDDEIEDVDWNVDIQGKKISIIFRLLTFGCQIPSSPRHDISWDSGL